MAGGTMFLIKRFLLFVAMASLLSSCGYTKLAVGKIRTKLHPTPENLKNSAPENCVLVTGNIRGDFIKGAPLAVVAVTRWESEDKMAAYSILPSPGPYYLYLPEGRYQIMVFTDLKEESDSGDELFARQEKPVPLTVEKGKAVHGIIRDVDISIDPDRPRISKVPFDLETPLVKVPRESGYIPSGIITTLDDEIFDEDNGFLGLYQPAVYLEHVNNFFYMQEEYDPGKIPVIFVHGIHGTPKDWSYIVEGLDRKRFQPWFFYYPSGLRLETITDIFYDTFLSKGAVKIDRMVIAALSQGGLVVRSALNRCASKDCWNVPQLFISFCSPFGGVDSAEKVVNHSPVIVPSWIDLASGSDYIKNLHQRELPEGTSFQLFFAYGSNHLLRLGPNDDGAISLKSQLDPKAQKEAAHIHGFNETHSEILRNREVLEEFNSILAGARL